MRIVELPLPLAPAGQLSLAALVARDNRMNIGWEIHLGNTYDETGLVAATTFQPLANSNRFAQHGTLLEDYSAETYTIDTLRGLVVQLDGPDLVLSEQTTAAGLANETLVFVGDEILSVVGYQLLGVGRYRIFAIRERLTSEREDHLAGAEVYLLPKSDLTPLVHDQIQVGNQLTFKTVLRSNGASQDLANVPAVDYLITGVMLFHLSPLNLRVNGQSRNPVYGAGTDVRFDWSLPSARSEVATLNAVKFRTKVQLVSVAGVTILAPIFSGSGDVLWSKLTYGSTLKILAASLGTILGSETDFVVRLTTNVRGRDFQFDSAPLAILVKQA